MQAEIGREKHPTERTKAQLMSKEKERGCSVLSLKTKERPHLNKSHLGSVMRRASRVILVLL